MKQVTSSDVIAAVIAGIILVVGAVVLSALLFSFPTMWLWNWLMPTLFKVPTIDLWQAIGLNFLCGILFKSGSGGSSKS